jgi:CoA:oxalate CoA-transferase
LCDARLPSAPVLTVEKAMRHPHLVERQTVQTVRDRILGEFQIPGFPLRAIEFENRKHLRRRPNNRYSKRVRRRRTELPRDQIAAAHQDTPSG